jgi:hypothetical protein
MYARTFHKAQQTRRFIITSFQTNGWEVRDEQDAQVLRRVQYTDWHRVERARMAFAALAMRLEDAGWEEG